MPKKTKKRSVQEWHPKAVAMGPGGTLGRPLGASYFKQLDLGEELATILGPIFNQKCEQNLIPKSNLEKA